MTNEVFVVMTIILLTALLVGMAVANVAAPISAALAVLTGFSAIIIIAVSLEEALARKMK